MQTFVSSCQGRPEWNLCLICSVAFKILMCSSYVVASVLRPLQAAKVLERNSSLDIFYCHK